MGFKVKVDFRKTVRALDKIQKKQVPFATAKSLTDLAKAGQAVIRKQLPQKFKIRAKAFIKRGIKIISAKKRDVLNLKAFSAVYSGDKIAGFMNIHEKGGSRRGKKSIAIPGQKLQAMAFRKASGSVKKKYLPSTLLKEWKGIRGSRSRTKSRVKKPFIIQDKNGNHRIVKRLTKKRLPLVTLYIFRKKVELEKKWDFEKAVKGVVQNKAKRIFEKNLKMALASAK